MMIQLSSHRLDQVHTVMALIKQHQTELDALKYHLTQIIYEGTGVNIDQENWTLDPSTGELHPTNEEGLPNARTPGF